MRSSPWRSPSRTDWCEDLCELLVWEDWGLLHRHETRPFAQIHASLADHAERFLLALADELRGHRLRRQADQALEHIAYLHIAAGRLTSFVPAAAKLGSDRWMPIVALARAAITRGRHDIARDVFAAADQPGLQRNYLHERCTELTGTPPDASARHNEDLRSGASTVRVPVYASRRVLGRRRAAG